MSGTVGCGHVTAGWCARCLPAGANAVGTPFDLGVMGDRIAELLAPRLAVAVHKAETPAPNPVELYRSQVFNVVLAALEGGSAVWGAHLVDFTKDRNGTPNETAADALVLAAKRVVDQVRALEAPSA